MTNKSKYKVFSACPMVKLFGVFFVLCVVSVLLTGCGSQSDKEQENQQKVQQANEQDRWNENFSQASLSDLEIGQHVSIMGSQNSDGSILAERIMIGNNQIDFQDMGMPRPLPLDGDNNNSLPGPPADFVGQRPDFEQMQNMSDEEREKMGQEMIARRGEFSGAMPSRTDGGMARLVGEIIDKDEQTLTLKLEEGGSKLIFFSDATQIMKIINSSS